MNLSSQTWTLVWKREKKKKNRAPNNNFMQLIPKGRTGFTEQVSPSSPHSCQQPCPGHILNKPGPSRTSPEGHRATLRNWDGHRCRQGLPTLAGNVPMRPTSCMSRPSTPHHLGSAGRAPLACRK